MAIIPANPAGGSPPGSRPPFPPRPRRFGERPQEFSKDEHRINERIRVPNVRLIDEVGGQVGVVPTSTALQMARDKGLDLMEISPNSNPPVCKICDYGKFKYEKKKKDHAAKKKQITIKVKEVQMRPQTDVHDRDYKMKNIREFLADGDKAKITMMFRGREVAYADNGYKLLREIAEELKEVATVEAHPKLEGKKMIMILAPIPVKKGQGKSKPAADKPASIPSSNPSVVITPKQQSK